MGDNVGEMRLQSDFAIARDIRTSCQWQGFINEQTSMANAFKAAMAKLAVVGQDTSDFVDCSEVVPTPVPAVNKPATLVLDLFLILIITKMPYSYPATKTRADVQQACLLLPFPHLSTDPGPTETIIP
jgi:hypothetical protein